MRTQFLGCCLLVALTTSHSQAADRLLLKNGFEISGDVENRGSRLVVRSEGREINLSARQLLRPDGGAGEEPPVRLSLTQDIATRGQQITVIPEFLRVTPFDEFGRRSIIVRGPKNKEIAVFQAITELYPSHVVVEGVNRIWKTTIALSKIPSEQLLPILTHTVDDQSPPDQLKIILYLIQAGRFAEAKKWIADTREKHDSLAAPLDELQQLLVQAIADRGLQLATQALKAGQFARATELSTVLAGSVPADLATRLETVQKEQESLKVRYEQARGMLGELRAEIPTVISKNTSAPKDETKTTKPSTAVGLSAAQLEGMLQELQDGLTVWTAQRLALALDLTAPSRGEQLALAMSGWVLGPEMAHQDLTRAVEQWQAWVVLRELRHGVDEIRYQEIESQLKRGELTVDILIAMLPQLPAPATTEADAETSFSIELAEIGSRDCLVYLPPEYDPYRVYPTIITLHSQSNAPSEQMAKWKPLAAEHGFIVLAPEYRKERSRPYEYSVNEHIAFLSVLREAKRRFAIDDDRVFLSGHHTGAYAAWDLGMSHPDLFAGLVPIGGAPMYYDKLYWPNLLHLPVYAVDGDFNGVVPQLNREQFTRYFVQGFDTIYVEYPGRGGDYFSEEFPNILKWMGHLTRTIAPRTIEAVSARYSDRRFYWVSADTFLPNATVAPELFGRSKLHAAKISATANDDNVIQVTPNGLSSLDILLSPKLVHLDDPRLTIRVHRKVIHQGVIEPELATMLRNYRETVDAKNPVVKIIRASNF